jgi:hypothetical protein
MIFVYHLYCISSKLHMFVAHKRKPTNYTPSAPLIGYKILLVYTIFAIDTINWLLYYMYKFDNINKLYKR